MSTSTSKPGYLFWIIVVLALLWNLAGVSQFFAQAMNTESWRANFTPEMLEIMDNLPLWYIVVFAIAVFISTFACVFLLFRKKLAVPLFLIGFFAVTIQCTFNLFINEAKAFYGFGQIAITIILPIVSFALYWYARKCEKKGWLT
ncbi:hypothetical protein [Portibacter marinus]|uniref:hypothetical protein n=1 Tax=Portibacter marinus TaxID=2898660 RepID=UPI001F1E20D5|nr:hypothetical protein [Portibacter marinus]